MPVAGPFTFLDYSAAPIVTDGVEVYPPQAGVFCICDRDTYGAAADRLVAYLIPTPVPTQAVMAGDTADDAPNTVTLHFADAATAQGVMVEINALPPVPSPPPPPEPPSPAPVSEVLNYRFLIALRGFPSLTGDPSRTLRDDWDAAVSAAPPEVQDRAKAPSFLRSDEMLNAQFDTALGDEAAAQALLDQVFEATKLVP